MGIKLAHRIWKEIEPYTAPLVLGGGVVSSILSSMGELPELLGWPLTLFLAFFVGILLVNDFGQIILKFAGTHFTDTETYFDFEFSPMSIRCQGKNLDKYKNLSGYSETMTTPKEIIITLMVQLKRPIDFREYSMDILKISGSVDSPNVRIAESFSDDAKKNLLIFTLGNIDPCSGKYRVLFTKK